MAACALELISQYVQRPLADLCIVNGEERSTYFTALCP